MSSEKKEDAAKSELELERLELDFEELPKVAAALDTEIESTYNSLCKIISDCEINGVPILGQILSVAQDRTTLKKLARVIDKIADKAQHYSDLKRRRSVIETMQEDVAWLGGALGSFSREIDEGLDKILAEIDGEDNLGGS